jgi:cobalt-zinc-cadmium resistance protein CzcA
MLSRLIDLSLQYRGVVFLATLLLIVTGVASFRALPLDAYPDTTPVQVTVNSVAPALTPLEVERQITFSLEQVISGLPGLAEVRSVSKFGFAQVTATFEDGTDIYLARQMVGERLQSAELPDGVSRPTLGPISTGLGEVFQYVVESDERDLQELRTLHHWVIRPQLLQVPGVAEINTWGGEVRQYHVIFDPDLLFKYELTLDDVSEALQNNNGNVGAGLVTRGGEAQLIQGIGLARSMDDIERIVIAAPDGVPIRISDVARVEIGNEVRRGAVTADGRGETVLGLGFVLMGENSRELTARLEARIEEVASSLPDDVRLTPVYSRTELVESVLETVEKNLLEGALFVIAILFIFLGNLRAGIIVALAIPLSMLFAFSAMLRFGIAGSLMSLGAIDFGLVVDSSVIMIENASRRIDQDTTGRSIREIVRDAAAEVRRPTLFGELIIAIVYLPILALEGVEGQLFRPMALTVIFALLGSMVLSLTLMPALATLVLKHRKVHKETIVVRVLHRIYQPILRFALSKRVLVIVLAAVALAGSVVVGSRLGSEFVPRLREQAIVINTVRLAGVSLEESVRYGTRLEQLLLDEFPTEIAHIWTRTGTAEVATDPMGLEVSDVFLSLNPRDGWQRVDNQDQLMAEIRETLDDMPGMRAVYTQPIEMRMNEMTAGIRADVGIKLFGDDFEQLRTHAEDIRAAVELIPGAADVSVEQLTGLPVLQIEVDRAAIARFGISVNEVLHFVESLGTYVVGEIVEDQMRFDLALRLDDAYRDDPQQLERILVAAPDGQRIPLSQLATITVAEGPSTIQREWGRRRIVIQANVQGRDIGSFVAEVEQAVGAIELPDGYYVRYGGQYEHLERAQARLAVVVPLALLLIFALLYITFGRARDALLVFTGVPFAAVGGVVALTIAAMPFSISAGVGFIAVSGVSVLGQLVLVSRVRQLTDTGRPLAEAMHHAAASRMRPVFMTGLVAAVGFIPMAFNTGVGAEIQRPLAIVVIGGVITSMIATLVVLPALYVTFGRADSASE